MESILDSVKKMLGITKEYEHFDQDIIIHINSVFMILNQLGVGPIEGFRINDSKTTWNEFLPENSILFEGTKSYMYAKVKLLFDPPSSSAVIEALNRIIAEFEWRLNIMAES